MIIIHCAQKPVDHYLATYYDDKTRDKNLVKTKVNEFSLQEEDMSKELLAVALGAIVRDLTRHAFLPDDRLSTNATLRSKIVNSFWLNLSEQKIVPPSNDQRSCGPYR